MVVQILLELEAEAEVITETLTLTLIGSSGAELDRRTPRPDYEAPGMKDPLFRLEMHGLGRGDKSTAEWLVSHLTLTLALTLILTLTLILM